MRYIHSICTVVVVAALTGCASWWAAPAPKAAAAPVPQPVADAAPASTGTVQREWAFANGDAGGWRLGWNTGEDTIVTELDVEAGLGLRLAVNHAGKGWGDSNIKLAWTNEQAPSSLSVRLLVPASVGKPKGPMQLGCAMNMPWTEAKSWTALKLGEQVRIGGKDYLAQTISCRLGTSASAPSPRELVLRFGGEKVRYQGPLYIQNIRAMRNS